MTFQVFRVACALSFSAFVLAPPQATATPGFLRLVDDRGKEIAGTLEVCFQTATRSDCGTQRGAVFQTPPEFISVRIEGSDHGPVSVRHQDLKIATDGNPVVTVPRKALLQISAGPKERLTASLYAIDDPTFRTPVFRSEILGGASLKVPAGDHLVSLLAAGRAPDLHLLSAKPGANERLAFRPRAGWSLVVRCRAEKEGTPVPGAQVNLAGMEGFSGQGGREERQVSEKGGLALFSGLSYLLASARVDHARFVPHHEEGISASPGTFAFREALLEEGGSLRARVLVEGKALAGVDCRVLEYDANPRGRAPEPKVHFQATTDKAGICHSGHLAAGPYTLRLTTPGNHSFLDRSVVLTNGDETTLTVPMVSIHVHGTVLRGSQPAPSYAVTFSDESEIKPNATRRDAQAEAVTNEDGEYEATLWSSADYDCMVRTPEGTPGGHKRLRLESAEERVDFTLEDHDIAGVVLDERDRPVADATVFLSWNRTSHRLSRTDAKGAFSFPLTEDGQGTVRTAKTGYLEPPPTEIEARPDAYPPPLILHLKRTELLMGRLLNSAGPAAGAALLSYRLEPSGAMTALGSAVADDEGRFELASANGASIRVFVTGAGCPLTFFDVVPSSEEVMLRCSELPASIELRFADPSGRPIAGKAIFARRDGVVIPDEVLALHLSGLRLPTATDGGGRLVLAGLAPGHYEIYLAEATNPALIASGLPNGLLNASSLAPLTTTELEITLDNAP